ncbi:MAG: hypothetical protein ACXABY_02560 [Candidatus Thorarchaeota archaeon]|jgi:hypothetical protein
MTEINVKIIPDNDAESPRTWDNTGIMACAHKRYNLGDEQLPSSNFNSWEEVEDYLVDECRALVILPLFLYDHSGITMNTTGFSCPWDSGQVGYIYITRETLALTHGWKKITKERRAKLVELLIGEVETYDQYLRGDVYGYSIEIEGEQVDSCWGFFGEKYAKEEAISNAKYYLGQELEDLEVSYA